MLQTSSAVKKLAALRRAQVRLRVLCTFVLLV